MLARYSVTAPPSASAGAVPLEYAVGSSGGPRQCAALSCTLWTSGAKRASQVGVTGDVRVCVDFGAGWDWFAYAARLETRSESQWGGQAPLLQDARVGASRRRLGVAGKVPIACLGG